MSKIILRYHSIGMAVGRSINSSTLCFKGNDCLIVGCLQFSCKYLMGREHVQQLYYTLHRNDNWDNEFREEPVNVFLSSVYMNIIFGCFFIICLYE